VTATKHETLHAIIDVLQDGPPLRLAVLFGSAAGDTRHPHSDVDVAVVPLDPDLPLSAELRIQTTLEQRLGLPVDLVRLDRAPMLVRWEVARTGLPLVAEPPNAWPRFVARAAAQHADEGPALRRAAERFRQRLASGASG